MPSKGALTLVKSSSAPASSALAWALASLASSRATSFWETTLFSANFLVLLNSSCASLASADLGVQLRLVEDRARP